MFSESGRSNTPTRRIKLKRVAHFNAAHRLHVPAWSDDKNDEVFGLCANQYYHGHNYKIEVIIEGEVDPITGFVMNLGDLKKIIEEEVTIPWDHKNLNLQIADFEKLNPTAENMAIVAWEKLRKRLSEDLELKVVLHETERNSVEYEGN